DLLYDAWDYGNDAASMSAGGCSGSGAMTYLKSGDYTVTVRVQDKSGGTAEDSAVVVVSSPPDQAPSKPVLDDAQPIDATGLTVNENQLMKFKLSSYDPDGTDVVYLKVGGPGSINKYTGLYEWQTTYTDSGTYTLKVKSSSNGKDSDAAEFTLTVGNTNRPPVASITFVSPNPATVGRPIIFMGAITDEDGRNDDIDKVIWDFKDGTIIEGTLDGSLTSYTYHKAGAYEVTFKTIDKSGASAEATETVTINPLKKSIPAID
ncbi:MAG: PKD domain-containing protein, partial [Candidatus Omnitrophica bacterium]|nr:PKD domain-containing protein [Candidatus Omnitrophota bacterium]